MVTTYDTFPGKDKLTRTQYQEIIKTLFVLATDAVVSTGIHFRFPKNLGAYGVRKYKNRKKYHVDWDHYNKYKEIRKQKNLHTEGYYAFFEWLPNGYLNKYKKILKFVPSRTNTRGLAKSIMEGNSMTKYFEK
jgi:hypothetical protein